MVNKRWRIRVSIPVPRACKARTLPIELIPLSSMGLAGDYHKVQIASVAQLVEHSTVNREVPGSIPGGSVFVIPVTKQPGGLAQSVECVVSNDEAPGSKPGFSTFW